MVQIETQPNTNYDESVKLMRQLLRKPDVDALVRSEINESSALFKQLKEEGIKSFIPQAEIALLRCMLGHKIAKTEYNSDGSVKKIVTEEVSPDADACLTFLQTMAPEEYKKFAAQATAGANLNPSQEVIDRLSRTAGKFLVVNMQGASEAKFENNSAEPVQSNPQ